MNYQGAKLKQMLAAEYVLGTLQGRARQRFDRLLTGDNSLRKEVNFWEQRLASFNRSIQPVVPREVVWAAIDHHINKSKITPIRMGKNSLNLWRGWAAISTAASVILSFGLWQEMQKPPKIVTQTQLVRVEVPVQVAMPFVAVLHPDKTDAMWKVSIYPERGMLKVAAVGQYKMDQKTHSLELWVVSADGPHSLGLLPMSGSGEMPMPKGLPMSGDLATLAISMEPLGGSTTGKPTGPVLLAAPALRPI
jgi:anti-sigma-K factor RskA